MDEKVETVFASDDAHEIAPSDAEEIAEEREDDGDISIELTSQFVV